MWLLVVPGVGTLDVLVWCGCEAPRWVMLTQQPAPLPGDVRVGVAWRVNLAVRPVGEVVPWVNRMARLGGGVA